MHRFQSARLACIYVAPSMRDQGVDRWLLDEALELARYFGLNHVVARAGDGGFDLAPLLEKAGFRSRSETALEIDLPPLYDEG